MPAPIIVVCGATATGKSAVAADIAHRLGSAVINADSMQVYMELNIGTGKPDAALLALAPHYGIDVATIAEHYSAARFKREMDPVLDRLLGEGTPPVVCGGTGLYLRALLQGIFPGAPRHSDVRAELHARAAEIGLPQLHAQLVEVDPAGAAKIAVTDERRIVRALEVFWLTGRPISELQAEEAAQPAREHVLWFGLRYPREVLRERIAARVSAMFDRGWIEEVRALRDAGHAPQLRRLRPLGYVEILNALEADAADVRAAAEPETVLHTQQFAKRQGTWFRNQHPVQWLDAETYADAPAIAGAICAAAMT